MDSTKPGTLAYIATSWKGCNSPGSRRRRFNSSDTTSATVTVGVWDGAGLAADFAAWSCALLLQAVVAAAPRTRTRKVCLKAICLSSFVDRRRLNAAVRFAIRLPSVIRMDRRRRRNGATLHDGKYGREYH
jgi:hypothetical protein